MQFEKIKNKGKARIFNNKYLEFFTKTHPVLAWGMYIPIITFLLYFSISVFKLSVLKSIYIFVGGVFFWTFFEYVMHRFVFHIRPKRKTALKVVYVIHGNHHEYPRDKQRLFMPPVPSIILASAIFVVEYFLFSWLGFRAFIFAFYGGFLLGYLMYGSMHYAIHSMCPPFKWMKALWRNHHLHHYKNDRAAFGVSTTIWDRLFNTMPQNKSPKEF